jgi:hypothetical protein
VLLGGNSIFGFFFFAQPPKPGFARLPKKERVKVNNIDRHDFNLIAQYSEFSDFHAKFEEAKKKCNHSVVRSTDDFVLRELPLQSHIHTPG